MISFWAVQARAAHRPEAVVRALERKMLVLSAAGSLQIDEDFQVTSMTVQHAISERVPSMSLHCTAICVLQCRGYSGKLLLQAPQDTSHISLQSDPFNGSCM